MSRNRGIIRDLQPFLTGEQYDAIDVLLWKEKQLKQLQDAVMAFADDMESKGERMYSDSVGAAMVIKSHELKLLLMEVSDGN